MSQTDARVGVYVCLCGNNISASVDVTAVADYAGTLSHVVAARQYQFMCSETGQAMIKKDIRELGVNRVVVASCSPRIHETTFQGVLKEAGLNPYYFEMANIREHCSWVVENPSQATQKAKRLVRGAVSRVVWQEPLFPREVSVSPNALVVGGGIAGIQAALTIADAGYRVYLVESDASIGGRMAQLDKTFPTLDCSACILTPKMVNIGRHPNITLLSYSEVSKVSGFIGNFKVRVKKKPRYIELDKCTSCGECTRVCPVEVPDEFDMRLGQRKAIYRTFAQAIPNAFVIDKRKSPCKITCPAHIPVQGCVALIGQGKFNEAHELIRDTMPFPSVCGRVCTHPCERECKRGDIDEPIAIAALNKFAADHVQEKTPAAVPRTKKEKIAVIGAGPAGLSAAYDLVRMGYGVTVFEALPVAGGMLAVGIPEYRLPKSVLNREIDYIEKMGVEIKLNSLINDFTTLRKEYQAVFVATGSHKSLETNLINKDARGVFNAIDFLRNINMGKEVEIGKKVAVIGGGNSAIDAARVAVRKGAEVHLFYRRDKKNMPVTTEEVVAAEAEGIRFHFLSSPALINSTDGRVTGLTLDTMELKGLDEDGRPSSVVISGSQYYEEVDTIIFAIGQTPDQQLLKGVMSFRRTMRGLLSVDRDTLETSLYGVFAGGDVVSASGTVVHAIAQGKRAARSIELFLQGKNPKEWMEKDTTDPYNVQPAMPTGIQKKPRAVMPEVPVKQRINNFKEVTSGFTEEQAIEEAQRCLNCAVCAECRQCETVCLPRAINLNMKEEIVDIDVGAILLATGHNFFHAERLPQYNYGRFPNIIESMEFERLCSTSGPTGGKILLANGKTPESVAIIHCVGSRDSHANSYCSRLCCMHAMKQAHLVREKTGAQVYELYIDIRAAGKGYEEFYEKVQREGVIFIRGRGAEVIMQRDQLVVKAEDTGLGRPLTLPVDMVILSTGMTPREDSARVAGIFHITRDKHGFFMESHSKLRPFNSNTDGIFLAGTCQSPRDIPDTVAHANAAAAEVLSLLARGKVNIEPTIAEIDPNLCSACLVCIPLCPYQAISVNAKKIAEINEVLCKGCGSCVAACPSGAIKAKHFSGQQIFAQIEGILA